MSALTPALIDLTPENLNQANWQQPGLNTLPVLTVKQLRDFEETAFGQIDSFLLMQAAGIRSALKIADQIAHNSAPCNTPGNIRCLVLAGPGNNGGDACIVAGELQRKGIQVELVQITEGSTGSKDGSKDRMQAVLWCLAHGVQPHEFDFESALPTITPNTIVVDGLLGIACNRPPSGLLEKLIHHVNNMQVHVYALDCPSGLNCDTGHTPGAAIAANTTFTYLACKHGLLTGKGKTLAGDIWVEALNCGELLKAQLENGHLGISAYASSKQTLSQYLPLRDHAHHKGSFGSIAVLGGQRGMLGACLLSARTALMLGSGRVAISLLDEAEPWFSDMLFPEIMNKNLEENLAFANTVIVGPGLGQSKEALKLLHTLLDHDQGLHIVWDADALNLLAANADLRTRFQQYRKKHRERAMILTPHPLEAARLLQSTTEVIQANRFTSVQSLTTGFDCTVVLKGAGTLICNNSQCNINATGGPALSTAGSGDVLAGAIAAMLGQGLNEFDAALFAVHLHGLAIEPQHREQDGLLVSHASEIAQRMKTALNQLLNQSARRNRQLS